MVKTIKTIFCYIKIRRKKKKNLLPLITCKELVLWDMSPPSLQDCWLSQKSYFSFHSTPVSQVMDS